MEFDPIRHHEAYIVPSAFVIMVQIRPSGTLALVAFAAGAAAQGKRGLIYNNAVWAN